MNSDKRPSEVIEYLNKRLTRYPTRIEIPTGVDDNTRQIDRAEFIEEFIRWLYDLDMFEV